MCLLRMDDPNSFLIFPQQLNTTIKVTVDLIFMPAMVICLSKSVTDSEAQARLFTLFCLQVIYPFPKALSFTQIMLYSFPTSGYSHIGGKQKLLAKL